jgi:hypothetical protein
MLPTRLLTGQRVVPAGGYGTNIDFNAAGVGTPRLPLPHHVLDIGTEGVRNPLQDDDGRIAPAPLNPAQVGLMYFGAVG